MKSKRKKIIFVFIFLISGPIPLLMDNLVFSEEESESLFQSDDAENFAFIPHKYDFESVKVGNRGDEKIFKMINRSEFIAIRCSKIQLSNNRDFVITKDYCGSDKNFDSKESCRVFLAAKPQSKGVKNTLITRRCVNSGTISSSASVRGI